MKTVIKGGENKSFDVLICEVIVCAFWISSDLNYVSVPNNYQHLLLNFFQNICELNQVNESLVECLSAVHPQMLDLAVKLKRYLKGRKTTASLLFLQ